MVGSADPFGAVSMSREQEDNELAILFEQLLIFEKVTIRTNRINQSLTILIKRLGLDTVERLIRAGYIRFMLWSPLLVTSTGRETESGIIDESVIYGSPPIVTGQLSPEDLDLEYNIKRVLNSFPIAENRKRQFVKKALPIFDTIDGMDLSKNAADLVIDSYKNNNLAGLGLPFEKEPDQLNLEERGQLLSLGHQVLETAVLSEFVLKSYDNYEHLKICENNLENIGRGYNISNNTSHLFHLENIPNLQQLYRSLRFDFDAIFKIRHMSGAKYYRKWINEIGDYSDAGYITEEYLKEIRGKYKWLDTAQGKFLKNGSMFVVGSVISALFESPVAGIAGGYGFGLLEDYLIDGLLKGHNAGMFINGIKDKIETNN